jgi:hypothetical protein
MNIIRTKVVELSTIPAIAYKIKLSSGGSGVKMHRTDVEATAFATIDKRTGSAIPDARVDARVFPEIAFDEALEELAGLPYAGRGKVRIVVSDEAESEEVADAPEETQSAEIQMLYSDEFNAIIDRFSDERGKINYALMNKQFMQFAQASKTVADMCSKHATQEDVLLFIIRNRAAHLAGKRENISAEEAKALIETIDEIDPRSAFKELNLYIRKRLSR